MREFVHAIVVGIKTFNFDSFAFKSNGGAWIKAVANHEIDIPLVMTVERLYDFCQVER